MAGATGVAVFAFAWAKRRTRTWLGLPMQLPAVRAITVRLVAGSAVFGIGWGSPGSARGPRSCRSASGRRRGSCSSSRCWPGWRCSSGSSGAGVYGDVGVAACQARVRRLRVQRDVTIDAIARHFPAGTRMSQPPGGMLLWIALPDGVRSEALFDAALAHGVRIAPGSIFSNSDRFDRFDGYIRRACTRVSDAAHEAAFETLGRLVREATAATYARCRPAGPANSQALRLSGPPTRPTAAISSAGRVRGEVLADQRQVTIADREIACGARPFGLAQPVRSCPDTGIRRTGRACAYARAGEPRARRVHHRPERGATPALGDQLR